VGYRDGFEPYIVASRSTLPRYDEKFIGRGWDKMSFFYELHAQRRRFVVLPPPMPFLVHAGRGDLPKNYTMEYMDRQRENSMLMQNFKQEIDLRYAARFGEVTATQKNVAAASHAAMKGGGDAFTRVNSRAGNPGGGGGAGASRPSPIEAPTTVAAAVPQVPKAVDASEPTPLRSDQHIDWPTISSSRGDSTACVSRWRHEELDEASTAQLEAALSYACQKIDCRPLHNMGVRHHPDTLVAHADWAFDRYLGWATTTHNEPAETACNFNGAAKLVACARQCFGCKVVPSATEERIGAALEWVCGPNALHDCGGILAAIGGDANRSVTDRASVLFSVFYNVHRCVHYDPDEACYFGGAAMRVPCSELPE
jgi:hypothetical protein